MRGYPVRRLVSSRPDGSGRVVFRVPDGTGAPYSVDEYAWSPDGTRLAVALTDYGGETFSGNAVPRMLVVARRDGSASRRLARCEQGNGPAWSPDGRLIAFSCLFGPVTVVRADGHTPSAVLSRRARPSAGPQPLAWRPDGQQIAYTVSDVPTQNGAYKVMLQSSRGPSRPGPPQATALAWSPDGRRYAYLKEPDRYRDPVDLVIARASDGRRLRTITLPEGSVIDWLR
jgi:Tol biopolymer transport system component